MEKVRETSHYSAVPACLPACLPGRRHGKLVGGSGGWIKEIEPRGCFRCIFFKNEPESSEATADGRGRTDEQRTDADGWARREMSRPPPFSSRALNLPSNVALSVSSVHTIQCNRVDVMMTSDSLKICMHARNTFVGRGLSGNETLRARAASAVPPSKKPDN